MKKPLLACFSFLAISACMPVNMDSSSPATDSADYRALGTEPFWSLTIGPSQIMYESASDAKPAIYRTPEPRPSFNGTRYVGENIAIDITHSPCSDGMSDRRYADTVTVRMDAKTLNGCGGAILPPESLNGTRWTITAINGIAPVSRHEARLDFESGKLSGSAGCNRFRADYTVETGQMVTGAVISTRMACPADIMAQEAAVLGILGAPAGIRYTPDGKLLLSNNSGVLVLERII